MDCMYPFEGGDLSSRSAAVVAVASVVVLDTDRDDFAEVGKGRVEKRVSVIDGEGLSPLGTLVSLVNSGPKISVSDVEGIGSLSGKTMREP